MRSHYIVPALIVFGATLSACSTVPEQHAVLESARSQYMIAQTDPDVSKHAAIELQQARYALDSAENAWSKKEDEALVDHLAYLAQQRALIAQDTGKLRTAEVEMASAGTRRDAVRLEARTAEADAAHRKVLIAQDSAAQSAAELAAATARVDEMEKELAELNAKKTERGLVITLGDVLFDLNKADLKPGSERNVLKVADFLKAYPERKALIEGFTDSTGSDSYNLMLSQRRAESVRRFLINNGVSADRVSAHGYGKSNPVASNATAVTRQLNRRVEIVVSDGMNDVPPR